MKRLALLTLMVILGTAAQAETVLICHAQSVPESLNPGFHSPLSAALLDKVFDYFFSRGDVAFDTAFSLSDGTPSAAWLGALSSRYGADKVVYVLVIWKKGEGDKAVLDRVDFREVGSQGTVMREGSFTLELVSPSQDETQQVKTVTEKVLAGLSS
jgi:hypothetical protein